MLGFLGTVVGKMVMGAGIKLASTALTGYLHNKNEEIRARNKIDEKLLDAEVELAKMNNKDPLGKINKFAIFMCLTLTFCFVVVWQVLNPGNEYSAIIPTNGGWTNPSGYKLVKTHGAFLPWQFMDAMYMILGSFCVNSRRR